MYDWQGWIPHEQNPHSKNPERGFLSSANQNPTDEKYPYYLNGIFAMKYRSTRINEWLSASNQLVPDEFKALQLDNKNLLAESVLPKLLSCLNAVELSKRELQIVDVLQKWDYFSDAQKIAPTVFDAWSKLLYRSIWFDEFNLAELYLELPSEARTVQLIVEEPDSPWFDNVNTPQKETLGDLITNSFKTSVAHLFQSLGENREAWQWAVYEGTKLTHLARVPGFGTKTLDVGGGRDIIVNATGVDHGPSWRMVVSLGPEVHGWGIYPGGQSGNSGSTHYDDFVNDWVAGELVELLFLKNKSQENGRIISTLTLR